MKKFNVRFREDVWHVFEVEAEDEDEARYLVECSEVEDLQNNYKIVKSGCPFCGIEEIEEV